MTTEEEAAERELSTLTAPLLTRASAARHLARLKIAVLMTTYGAGLRLIVEPGIGRAVGGACAALLWVCLAQLAQQSLLRYQQRLSGGEPWWVAAAVIHGRSQAGRVKAGTLAAAARYLPAMGRRYASVHLYVPRCADPGRHDRLCVAVGTWAPSGRLLLIVGEQVAAVPDVAAASMAHELRHLTGWTNGASRVIDTARSGWGWALTGAIWAFTGTPWTALVAAAAGLHVLLLIAQWLVECGCDASAARTEGPAALLDALTFFAAHRVRAEGSWLQRSGRQVLAWLAGPSHPPLALRSAIIRAQFRTRR
ncbi:MAG TPA: hypothetical protein VMV92_07070 [Streptosporangiaceae bacterium]|nr:hypothetical protein [Streptosporangiaceae bacterium]